MMVYMFAFSKGFASVPIPAMQYWEQSLDGMY